MLSSKHEQQPQEMISKLVVKSIYTFLSILLATFNYRVHGMCVPIRAFHARLAR